MPGSKETLRRMLSSAAASLVKLPSGFRIAGEISRMKTALMRGVFGFGRMFLIPRTIPTVTLMRPSSVASPERKDLGFQSFNCEPLHLDVAARPTLTPPQESLGGPGCQLS